MCVYCLKSPAEGGIHIGIGVDPDTYDSARQPACIPRFNDKTFESENGQSDLRTSSAHNVSGLQPRGFCHRTTEFP